MKFLRNLLAVLTGLTIFFLLFILIIVSISSQDNLQEVKENSVLTLKLNQPISERTVEDPINELLGESNSLGVIEIKKALKHAKDNDKIKGLYIEQGFFSSGLSKLTEIRDAIEDFKESGKFVVSYGEYYSERGYYLSSISDEVYISPKGYFEFNGFVAEITFFKGLFDKLDINYQVFRPESNVYKNAVEPFTRKDMSDETREEINKLLVSIRGHLMESISESREMEVPELDEIMDSLKIRIKGDAFTYGLVDDTIYFDQVEDKFRESMELEEDDKVNYISITSYNNSFRTSNKSKNRIAVIVGDGTIVSGPGEDGATIGSEKYAKLLRDARRNDKVKAVVLRVNSPGGSYLASDIIWREVMLTAKEKPVIASMSDVAASGGYYISMAADTIVAEPTTLTGSIGIYSMIPDMSGFLENKLGITSDRVKSGEYSDLYTVTRSLTEQEKSIILEDTKEGYVTFTTKAAQGRNMDYEKLLSLAAGRSWTGEQAVENGLVDLLGGLDLAIEIAAEKAEISDDYRLVYYPEQKNFFDELMSGLSGGAQTKIMEREMGELYPYVEKIKEINEMVGLQARMPFDLDIR